MIIDFFKKLENHLGVVLTCSIVIGLFLPSFDHCPSDAAILIIAAVIFVSCFKISKQEFLDISFKRFFSFYVIRFILFPPLLYHVAAWCVPEYATALFLLTLMPVGIASPAVSGMLGGPVTTALALVVVSSLLAPFVVPFMFYLNGEKSLDIDLLKMFFMLSAVIFIPLALHLPIRKWRQANRFLLNHNRSLSVILFALLMSVVVAVQRQEIINEFSDVLTPLLVLIGAYLLYYFIGWLCSSSGNSEEQITFMVCSGVNNNALGITLAISCLPSEAPFLVLTVIPWCYGMVLFKKIVK